MTGPFTHPGGFLLALAGHPSGVSAGPARWHRANPERRPHPIGTLDRERKAMRPTPHTSVRKEDEGA